VYFENLSTASLLLDRGASVRSEELGFGALHLAAATGSEDATRLLLSMERVNVDEQDIEGNTALVYALSSTRLPYGTQFVGVEGFRSGIWGSAMMSFAGAGLERPRSIVLTNLSPTAKQRRELIQLLLSQGANANKDVSLPGAWTGPVLLKLCWSGNLWGARYLLEHGLARPEQCMEQLRLQPLQTGDESIQATELLHEFV
jgi:ankyrin repeat protein